VKIGLFSHLGVEFLSIPKIVSWSRCLFRRFLCLFIFHVSNLVSQSVSEILIAASCTCFSISARYNTSGGGVLR